MGITLAEALTRGEGKLKLDELNSLIPQTIQAVLMMEGAIPGATVGDWEIVETEEGFRGFATEFPGILLTGAQRVLILQLSEDSVYIYFGTENGIERDGIVNFVEKPKKKSKKKKLQRLETDEEIEVAINDIGNFNLIMCALMLNTDLFHFLAGEEPISHQQISQEIRSDLLAGAHQRKKKRE